jgi:glycosyltransferase involved in cell wall biosynthesis
MNQNNLITIASFTPNLLNSPSAWLGHMPFAGWIIQEIKPKLFVELGTHYGHSYFSFCQAVVEAGLSTKCYAIDTWQGDEHAGQYGEQIFGKVNAYHQEHYAGFSGMLRMTFDDAVTYFADESIELMHIDGLHTYEAVRHDFDNWLPKLAPGAVVMFHDTNVRERNFGVWKLWEELQASYPNNLEFMHSYGLGVLQLNNAPNDKKLEWLQPNSPEKQNLIKYFDALGARQRERYELNELKQHIANLNPTVTERDEVIVNFNQTAISYADALKAIEEIRGSSYWQITLPIRYISSKTRNIVSLFNLLPRIIRFGGGVRASATKAGRVFSREGWSGVKRRILFVGGNRGAPPSSTIRPDLTSAEIDRNDYSEWVRRYDTLTDIDRNKIKSKIAGFAAQPLISVIMPVYNPPLSFLEEAIRSVRNQLYSNWELCIADDASTDPTVRKLLEQHRKQDGRIKVVYRKQNGHISRSSNSALELAQGEFVALLDHDDLLAEHALYWAVDAINRHPDVGLIYSDEDKIDESNLRHDPYFKCALNYELLLAQNMISHLGIYRTDIVSSLGGFRVGYEGSQDYDLTLRVIERLGPNQIIHIPHVLYHWRAIAGSTALAVSEKNYAVDASRKAVTEHLERRGISAEVMPALEAPMFNRVRFTCPSPQPLVSIIIPTRDRADLLGMCIDSLIQRTTYSNYEVIIMDNGSVEDATRQLFDRLPSDRFRVLRDESPFNFSALNNNAARAARGELLCLMNNDIEILTPDWLEEMVSFAIRSDIGCVGARLWYPDGALQHGGVLLGIGGVANHAHYKIGRGNPGYFGRAVLHQSLSAVTGACLIVRRQVFEEVGGLDEQLAVAFNDIDFCLRVREAGYRNVWTPYAEMNHHESASRKNEDTPEKLIRFRNEVGFMQDGWGELLLDDPAYSPNLTLDDEHFSYAWPPRVSL